MKQPIATINQKGKFTKRIGLILTALVFAAFIYYVFTNKDDLQPLLEIEPGYIGLIFLTQLTMIFSNGLFIKIILTPFKKFIAVKEAFYVSILSTVGNFFAPVGAGFGFRAVYLKRKHGLTYSNYFSTLSGNYIIVFLVTSVFGLLGILLLREEFNYPALIITAIFTAMLAGSIILMVLKPSQIPSVSDGRGVLKKVGRLISDIVKGWTYVAAHKSLLFKLIVLTTVNLFLAVVVLFFITTSLHIDVSIPALLLLSVLGSLSLFINITPGNLGVKEAVFIFSSTMLGLSVNNIILIALIDRGVMFLTLAILWLYSLRLKNKKNFSETKLAISN